MIGNDGLTPAVLKEIERALKAHELIKVRGDERRRGEPASALLGEICARDRRAPVQHIGKVLVVYRERPAGRTSRQASAEAPAPGEAGRGAEHAMRRRAAPRRGRARRSR